MKIISFQVSKLLVLPIFLAFLSISQNSIAAFVVTNSPSGGDGYVDINSPTEFTLYSSNNSSVINGFVSLSYTDTALFDAIVSFNWKYFTQDIAGSTLDPAGYMINGSKTQLSDDGLPQYSVFPTSGLGFSTFNVSAGDTFGFYVDATDNTLGRGQLSIKNLSILPVPEPETYAMFLAGLGLLGFASRRKQA